MRLSQHFGHSLRQVHEVPEDHGAYGLLRAGYAVWERGGRWALWPLGVRLLHAVERIWREKVPGLPVAAPGAVEAFWQAGMPWGGPARSALPAPWRRWLSLQVTSYRDLPRTLLGHWWGLHLASAPEADPWNGLEDFWRVLGLDGVRRLAGTAETQVWAFPHPHGEVEALTCECGYQAVQPWAVRAKTSPEPEAPRPLREVPTPGANTIQALAKYLDIPAARTAKAVFLTEETERRLVFAVVRGDMDVSLPKVRAALGCGPLRPATEEEIRAVGAEPGYASPIGVEGARVVVDTLIPQSPNLVAGANRPDTHFVDVNYGRDFQAEVVADIVATHPGDPCPRCGRPLEAYRVFPLAQGTALRPDPEVSYRTREGQPSPLWWSPMRLDPWALLVALAAVHRDEGGLRWPPTLAPYPVHLVALRGGEEVADRLVQAFARAGIEVLYDDRPESPGVKFTDADLLGMPLRLTVGKRSLAQGGVEIRVRATGEGHLIPVEEVVAWVQSWLEEQR